MNGVLWDSVNRVWTESSVFHMFCVPFEKRNVKTIFIMDSFLSCD